WAGRHHRARPLAAADDAGTDARPHVRRVGARRVRRPARHRGAPVARVAACDGHGRGGATGCGLSRSPVAIATRTRPPRAPATASTRNGSVTFTTERPTTP